MRAPLVPVALAFLLGIVLGEYATPQPVALVVSGFVSAAAALWGRRRAKARVLAIMLLWFAMGALRMATWQLHLDTRLAELLADDPQPVELHGLVVDDPVELFEPGEAQTAEGGEAADPDRQVCVLALRHQETARGWQPICGRVRVTVYSPRDPLRYGDDIVVEGEWSRVPDPGNPGQYDWQAALARKRIHGLLRVRPFDGLVVLRRGQGNPVLAAVFRLRERWGRLIQEHFEPRDVGLLLALLLGERADIDEELKAAFVETGTIHLLVISGFNVGLIALLLEWLLRLLGVPWRPRLLMSAIGLGGYCVLTGLAPPVVRATLMAWVVLGALALDRVISWPNTLAAAALAMCWIDPTQLFDPGFQLSFGAVISLLAFARPWAGWLDARLAWARPRWLRRYLAISLSATSAVWVGLVPVLAWYFRLVAPVSLLANLLLAPLVSGLVSLGTTLLLAATLWEPVVAWGRGVLMGLLDLTVWCVAWCHALPGGRWFVSQPSPVVLVGYYGLLALSLRRRRLGWSHGRLLVLWVGGLTLWVSSTAAMRALDSRWMRVDVLDVGHGDSIVVRLTSGHTLLVDAGTEEAGRFRVVPFLRSMGVTRLDAVVLTHADEDHVGGAVPVLTELSVRALLTNGARGDTMSARRIHRLAAAQGIPQAVAAAGTALDGGAGVMIDVLHPPRGLVPGLAPESNDNSLVLKLTKGSVSILLTGDIEEAGLPWLLRHEGSLRAAVLKVPHHGSRLGRAGERLFRAVRPRLAVLSVGRAHRLPSPEIIRALVHSGAVLHSTREDGAIALRTDGVRLQVRTFRGPRAWRTVPSQQSQVLVEAEKVPGTF